MRTYSMNDYHYENKRTESRKSSKKRSGKKAGKRKLRRKNELIASLFSFAACLAIVLFLIITTTVKTKADVPDSNRVKYYKTIQVNSGDTLWSIAEEYMSHEYSDIDDYIKEVKEINNMVNSKIYAYEYICVPYYDD